MKPRFFTIRNFFLMIVAASVFGGLAYWINQGMPLPGQGVPSTAGKIAYVSTQNGHADLFMMNADGSNSVALTNDEAEDHSPLFSPNGTEITFTSANRKGVSAQVCRMDAMPKARVLMVTNTSGTKDAPRFTANDIIHYLDTGKIVSADIKTNETDAEFPEADQRQITVNLFSTGGVDKMAVAPKEKRYMAVMKMEDGRALVLVVPEEQAIIMLGVAKDIHIVTRPEGGWVAVYSGGTPLEEPRVLLSPELMRDPAFSMPILNAPLPEGINALAIYDNNGKIEGQPEPLPAPIESMALSPDGKQVVFAFAEGEQKGLLYHALEKRGQATLLTNIEAREPAFSPDGQQVAFVSGSDIYTIPVTGGTPKNLTQGKGTSSEPTWSPVVRRQ